MPVLLAQFMQETNSFSPAPCGLGQFEDCFYAEGEAVLTGGNAYTAPLQAMYNALAEAGIEAVPVVSAVAWAAGPVDVVVANRVADRIAVAIEQQNPIDGIFLVLHGAMAIEEESDGEGWLLERIRAVAGSKAVVVASLDFHANITGRMMRCADILCGYHTYPHIDMVETALRACKLGIRILKEGISFHSVAVKLPMLHQAEACMTTEEPIYSLMDKALRLPCGVGDVSVFQMQPWLDAEEAGACVVVIGRDVTATEQFARVIGRSYWDIKDEICFEPVPLREAFAMVESAAERPVILADSADSPTAGAPGTSAALLGWVAGTPYRDLCGYHFVVDPTAVATAWQAGEGQTLELTVGFQKVPITARIVALCDRPVLVGQGVYGNGEVLNVGRSAVLQWRNCYLVTAEIAASCCYPELYTAHGLVIGRADYVVVKSASQYKTYYAPLSQTMLTVDTPGPSSANLRSFPYRRLPRPIHPLDDIRAFTATILKGRSPV